MRNLVVAGLLALVVGLAACGGSEKAISTPGTQDYFCTCRHDYEALRPRHPRSRRPRS